MRHSIIIAATAVACAIAASVAIGCDPAEKNVSPFDFSLVAEPVDQGEPVTVTIALTRAGEYSSFRFAGSVYELEVTTGREYLLRDVGFYSGGEEIVYNQDITLPGGRKDLSVVGLPAGTYRIEVGLIADSKEVKASCVTVVKRTGDGGEDEGGDDKPVRVSDFSFPSVSGGAVEVEKGKTLSIVPSVSPDNASDKTFVARSDNAGIAKASSSDGVVFIEGVSVGNTVVYVTAEGGKGVSKTLGVRVTEPSVPQVDKVTDFTLPSLDATYGRVCVEGGKTMSFTPSVTPSTGGKDFKVLSSDEGVVKASCSNGTITLTGIAPGKASVVITADGGNGITKTLPVLVFKNVKVTIAFEELEASEVQLKTKTFPCKLKFSSDSNVAFPTPIVWSVTARSVVNSTGRDSQVITDKTDVSFKGNRVAYYDMMQKIEIPSYNIWRTTDYSYSITLTVVMDNPLDGDIWRLTFDEQYKTQDARIKRYITSIQQ